MDPSKFSNNPFERIAFVQTGPGHYFTVTISGFLMPGA